MTVRPSRLVAPALAAVLAPALLAGCVGGTGGDPTSTVTVTETPEPLGPAQQELTGSELTAALPNVKEVPTNFAADPVGRDPEEERTETADPADCLAVELDTPQMRTFRREHMTAADQRRYSATSGVSGVGLLTVEMWTHDEPYPRAHLDEAGAAVGECATYTVTSNGTETGPWEAKTTPIPLLGDQSLGVRVGDRRHDIAVDHLWVSSGHNLLHVSMVTGYREDNEDLLERAAEGVLERLQR